MYAYVGACVYAHKSVTRSEVYTRYIVAGESVREMGSRRETSGEQAERIGWCRAKSAESRIKFAVNTKGTMAGTAGTVSLVEGVCK